MRLLCVLLVCAGSVRADRLVLVNRGQVVSVAAGTGVDDSKAPAILRRELRRRAPGATLAQSGKPTVRFSFTDRFEVGPEGFELFIHDGKLDVVGYNDRSLCYAAGEVLRHCHVRNRTITLDLELNPWLSRPTFPLRAVLWDPVEGTEYGRWNSDRLGRWLDELVLWGMNTMVVPLRAEWGDPGKPASLGDADSPAAKARRWQRVDRVIGLAQARGLHLGVVVPPNGVFPERLRRQPVLRATPAGGAASTPASLACPSRIQGRLAILKTYAALFRHLPRLDYLYVRPLANSGCWCADCRKRGWAEVYLDMARRLKEAAALSHPHVRLMLSDAGLDQTPERAGEWPKLLTAVAAEENDWIDLFAWTRPDQRPPTKRAHGVRFGLLEADPFWPGRFGSVPLLRTFPARWRRLLDAGPKYRGFMVETRSVDDWFNVLAALRWNWSPRRTPENLADFTTRYYFGDEAAAQLAPLVLALDHGIRQTADGRPSPFGAVSPDAAKETLKEARQREQVVRKLADALPEAVRRGELFQSLMKRVTKEARFFAAAGSAKDRH